MSGQLFYNTCDKIDAKIAPFIQQAIIKEIQDVYPNLIIIPIGSVGKKSDFNSDIDIAIVTKDINQLKEIISSVFDYTEYITIESVYIVSIKYPYEYNGDLKYVQCDFINVWDADYTKFRYYCPDYTKGESKYKVGQKIMFANMIINHTDNKNEGLSNGQCSRFKFEPTGLFRYIYELSNNRYKSYLYTLNPKQIAKMCFSDGDISHFNSVETLWETIHSNIYKYPEEVKELEKRFFVYCHKKGWTNIHPEDFYLQYWTVDEINNFIKNENLYHNINKVFSKISDMENK